MKRVLIAVLAIACLAARKPPAGLSLDARSWNFDYSPCMPAHPTNLQGIDGFYLDFPTLNGCRGGNSGSVNYLTQAYRISMLGKTALTFTAQIQALSGTPYFNGWLEPGNTCPTPAMARLMIQKWNDDLSEPYGRWWSNPIALELDHLDTETVTTLLTPDQWSSVYGEFGNASAASLAGFNYALNNPGHVGWTFGAGCFYGHGVRVENGTARMIVTNIQVQ